MNDDLEGCKPTRATKLILAAMQDKRTAALARLFDENRKEKLERVHLIRGS